MSIRVLFVQPVLAPYSIPRYQALAESGALEVYIALEAEKFPERPGWVQKPIPKCHIQILNSYLKTKTYEVKDKGFKESHTKAVPYGLVAAIYKIKPAMVVVCNPTEFLFALIARIAVPFQLGLVLEDTLVSEQRKHPLVRWMRKKLYGFTDLVFCFSEDAVAYAKEISVSGKMFRSSWSVNPDWLTTERHRIGRQDSGPGVSSRSPLRFLCVGSLSERKGVMPLLRAWREFSENRSSDLELAFVGEGPLREEMELYCSKYNITNIKFLGRLPYDDTKEAYLSSDIFIFPTLQDVYGLVQTEAMAFGLPVLTTIYCGARELVREGVNGYVFDPLDQESTIAALNNITDKRSELAAMGRESRNIISNNTHKNVMARMERDICSSVGQ